MIAAKVELVPFRKFWPFHPTALYFLRINAARAPRMSPLDPARKQRVYRRAGV